MTKRNKSKLEKQRREPKSTNAKYAENITPRKAKRENIAKEIKRQTIKLYLEGNSGRAVGRILGIGKNMCLYCIRKYAKNIEPKVVPNARVKVIEMD